METKKVVEVSVHEAELNALSEDQKELAHRLWVNEGTGIAPNLAEPCDCKTCREASAGQG